MNILPSSIREVALFLERLPGIGEKTANRLAFYFLRLPDQDLKDFADTVKNLKEKTKLCQICLNLTEGTVCTIDEDASRDRTTITVVEEVLDIISLETGNIYKGTYHVLHGRIDPMNNIQPEDIYIQKLIDRLEKEKEIVQEVILATNPNMEGEATAMFIKNKLEELQNKTGREFKLSRLGYGLPIGANLEYADYMTLRKSLENRRAF